MKKSICIYGSLVAALLANAAELTRDEVIRKLAELRESKGPPPISNSVRCYNADSPRLLLRKFTCSKCGEETYHSAWEDGSALDLLAYARASYPELRKLCSNIVLDDTDFCSECNPDKRIFQEKLYFTGLPEDMDYKWNGLKVKLTKDIKIRMILSGDIETWILFPEFWVEVNHKRQKGEQKCDVRIGPGKEYRKIGEVNCRQPVLNPQYETMEEFSKGWRVILRVSSDIPIPENAELPPPPYTKWHVTFNGKTHSVPVKYADTELLIAFFSGKDIYVMNYYGIERAVKGNHERIAEILLNQPPAPKPRRPIRP